MRYKFHMNYLILLLSLILVTQGKLKQTQKVSSLSQEQMRKTICMSLSRMHIEDHMDSLEEVLDSEDEERTMKLATLLDKSFRKCMKNVELDLNKLGKNYFLGAGLQDKETERQIDKVFGKVEYEKNGELVSPYSVEQSRHDSENKKAKDKGRDKQSRSQTKAEKNNERHKQKQKQRDRKAPLASHKKQKLHDNHQEFSNYEYSEEHVSEEQVHSKQQTSNQNHNSDEQHKQMAAQPYQDVLTEIQVPLQDDSRSILVYFYPILLIVGIVYYRFPSLFSKITTGQKILKLSENWDEVLKQDRDLCESMLKDDFDKVSKKVEIILSNQDTDYQKRKKILEAYIMYLNKIIPTDPNKEVIKSQLEKADKQNALLPFCKSGAYSKSDLEFLEKNKVSLITRIDSMPFKNQEKRQFLIQLYPYVQNHIIPSIINILEMNPDPKIDKFEKYLFRKDEIDKRNETIQHLKLSPIKRKEYIENIAEIVAQKYKNLRLAEEMIQSIIQDDFAKEEGKILFSIKMASIFVYRYCTLNYVYKVKGMTQKQILDEYFKTQRKQTKDLKQIAPILRYLKSKDGSQTQYIEKNYAFTKDCSLEQTIKLFELDVLKVYHRSAISLVAKVRLETTQAGLYYKSVEQILKPYQKKREVKEFLSVLKCCEILSCYGVICDFSKIENIIRTMKISRRKVAAEKIHNAERSSNQFNLYNDINNEAEKYVIDSNQVLKIYTQMISNYVSGQINKSHRLVADDKSILDIEDPVNLLSSVRHLKKNFYGSQENMMVYDIVYLTLIKSKLKQNNVAIKSLMSKEVIEDFNMGDYIDFYFGEFIEFTLANCKDYAAVEKHIKDVLVIAKEEVPDFKDPPKLQLIKYLYSKGCRQAPSSILQKPDRRLYEQMLYNQNIKQSQLDQKLKNINKMLDSDPEQKKYVREYMRKNVKKLFKQNKIQEGIKQLKQIQKQDQGEYCSLVLQIIEINPATTKMLLSAAYKRVFTASQFQSIMNKYNREFKLSDFLKKYQTNQFCCEGSIVKKEKQYDDAIKSLASTLSHKQEYKLFYYLLGTKYEQAFYYAYKKNLSLSLIDKLISQYRVNVESWESEDECYMLMEKLMSFSYLKNYEGVDNIKFREFKNGFKQPNHQFNIYNVYRLLIKKQTQDKQKNKQNNEQYAEQKDLFVKYFWKNRLIEAKSAYPNVLDVLKQEQIKGQIPIAQQLVKQVCRKLNKNGQLEYQNWPKLYSNIAELVTINIETMSECSKTILKYLNKLSYVVTLLKKLKVQYKEQNHDINQIMFDRTNILLIEMLSKLEQSIEFKGIFPPEFLYTPISVKQNSKETIPMEYQKVIVDCIQHSNVFLLARIMYNIYGMNKEIQNQVYKIFQNKYHQSDPALVQKFKLEAIGEYKNYQK